MMESYFINPVIDALATASAEERPQLIRRIAACVGDESALRNILGIDPEEFARFYPDMETPEHSTSDTIDAFINIYAKDSREMPGEMPLAVAPAVDYASMLEDEPASEAESDVQDETSDLISSFLRAVPPKVPKPARKPVEKPAEEALPDLSGELFKLMVKNKNYTKALEIITELSLNNPKKSVYFAYQMRFLKKLIKNQEFEAKNIAPSSEIS